jgi:hypothetical protein
MLMAQDEENFSTELPTSIMAAVKSLNMSHHRIPLLFYTKFKAHYVAYSVYLFVCGGEGLISQLLYGR